MRGSSSHIKPMPWLIALGIALIFYLSWLPQPKLGLLWFMPKWLAPWVDARANDTIRTGVPFVLIGFLVSLRLVVSRRPWHWWLASWFGLVAIVMIAEVGQLFEPHRIFDWGDIMWGAVGSVVGLAGGGMAAVSARIWKFWLAERKQSN
jgi:hypothetical protein